MFPLSPVRRTHVTHYQDKKEAYQWQKLLWAADR